MTLVTIGAGVPFLPALASLWREKTVGCGWKLHDGLIVLPTRRAARALAAAFLDHAQGAPMLLPRIAAIGGLDEAPLALAGALVLPPAIPESHRRAVLAKMILAMRGAAGAPRRSDAAWLLAGDLASLMDDAERAEIDLKSGLLRAADPGFAEHWNLTLEFLQIVTAQWPEFLAQEGLMNPAARRVALLDAQAVAWRETPTDTPVMVVGNAGDIPAVGRLLRVVGDMARGMVVLPGLDMDLSEAAWQLLDESHPQAGLRALLGQMGTSRADVTVVHPGAHARSELLRTALLPAAALDAWQNKPMLGIDGISRLHPSDGQEEAVCIALILREALEQAGAQAALVTPDRVLAQRVAAELARWGVVADDSAGEPLAQTPQAAFLRLLAQAVCGQLAPVPLLALLKHPLAAAGMSAVALRHGARQLELSSLRGPPPLPGLAGLRRAIDKTGGDGQSAGQEPDALLTDLLTRLEYCLEPLLRATSAVRLPPADLLSALITAAEALAATNETSGPTQLWKAEEGQALAQLLAETLEALPTLPPDDPACLPGLLDAVLAGAVVRSRRTTRGRGTGERTGAEHPRIFIWGLLEARLQSADLIVLGGLNEGVWPPAADPGPWMNRPMRARVGLPSPELSVGQAAHDFCMAACAAPEVVLSAPRRRDGAPAVASRWLVRLEALLGKSNGPPLHRAASWAAQLDLPSIRSLPAERPRPTPPVAVRPRVLAVTDIATLLRDPYEIYGRRILRLRELDPLEQSTDFRDYGSIVHQGLDSYLRDTGTSWPADAATALASRLHQALRDAGVREALIAWWSPRLARIASWVDSQEVIRRAAFPLALLAPEAGGEWVLPRPGGAFALRGRADRIERRRDGAIAILDYKTGTLPSRDDALKGREPQLLLEAAMVNAGAFGPDLVGRVEELTYWRLTGNHKFGELRIVLEGSTDGVTIAAEGAADELATLIDHYDDPSTGYPAQPMTARGRHRPYAQLSRAAEWGLAADEDAAADDMAEATDD